MKYKVGDKVRVRKDLVEGKYYYMEDRDESNSVTDTMLKLSGKVVTISEVSNHYFVKEDKAHFRWTDEMFEPIYKFAVGDKVIAKKNAPYGITTDGWIGTVESVGETSFKADGFIVKYEYFDKYDESEKIIIIRDGNTITAKLYKDNKVVNSAEAKCAPEDKFDFNVGAKLAFERLVNPIKIVKQKRYRVGDKVKIVDKWVPGCGQNRSGEMDKWLGKVMTIRDTCCGDYRMKEDRHENGNGWYWNDKCIEGKVINESEGFEIGDIVKVVNTGKVFTTYSHWSGLKGYESHFVNGKNPNCETRYKIVNLDVHGTDSREMALIQNMDTTQVFIIETAGIEKC